MEEFITYLENSLADEKDGPILYKFRRVALEEMSQRANEVEARGLTDKKVISDLIISEYPDIKERYHKYYKSSTAKQRSRKRLIGNALGSVLYILILLTVFLAISFRTNIWHPTWVLMVGGVMLWVSYLLDWAVAKLTSLKKFFCLGARVVLGVNVMLVASVAFLVCMAVFKVPNSWVIFIGGVIGVFVADLIYITATKKRLALVNYLAYIPPIFTMLYIVLGGVGLVPWNTGWIMIPLSLILDIIIIIAVSAKNSAEKREVEKQWKED